MSCATRCQQFWVNLQNPLRPRGRADALRTPSVQGPATPARPRSGMGGSFLTRESASSLISDMRAGAIGGGLVAFLGPSLPADEARRIVPGVVLLPPVCQGDLTSAVLNLRPRAILVVDGEFGQALSVWHKEILDALDRGVRVLGASSMGALRAAELDRFGMEGVGAIYEHYRDGWLTNDADVALVHASADDGYRAVVVADRQRARDGGRAGRGETSQRRGGGGIAGGLGPGALHRQDPARARPRPRRRGPRQGRGRPAQRVGRGALRRPEGTRCRGRVRAAGPCGRRPVAASRAAPAPRRVAASTRSSTAT